MANFKILFLDYFNIDQSTLDKYGALNICLSADMPLFIDPFYYLRLKTKNIKTTSKFN